MIMEQKEKKKVVYKLPMLIIPAMVLVVLAGILWRLFNLRAKAWLYVVTIVVALVVIMVGEVIAYAASKAMEKDPRK